MTTGRENARHGGGEYWNIAQPRQSGVPDQIEYAVERLLQYERPAAALFCLEGMTHDREHLFSALALRTLEALLTDTESAQSIDTHSIAKVFNALQKDLATDVTFASRSG